MLQRRNFLSGSGAMALGALALVSVPAARAQRPANPIARPPGQRLAGALVAGRFDANGGVATGATPGVYSVVAVDTQAESLQLRDGDGRTALVYVNGDNFDLASVKPGDEVEVDFLVPEPGRTRLEAGGVWKVQR
jgi:hypothetical protein